jgi:CubicO group peptidase (beta-lactamase class C family)
VRGTDHAATHACANGRRFGQTGDVMLASATAPLLIALAQSAPPDTEPAAAPLSARIDRAVARLVRPDGPGLAVLVLKRGEVLHQKGYGLANVEHQVPIDARTTFDLASVSKQFTAYAMLILEAQGKLALSDDARKLLPELPVFDEKRPIRLEDLLHHVSGLPDYLFLKPRYPKRDEEMTNADVAELVAQEKLSFPTGAKWEYSNTNYVLAALAIERASGRPFARFLREEIFEPLGMSGTVVFDRATQVIPRRAYGYSRRGRELEWVHSDLPVTGDGSVWTCLEDLVKWDAELREPKLVSEESLDRAFTSGRLDDGAETGYGLGWGVGRDGAEPLAEHSGGWAGFLSHHARWLDSGLTVVVLTNNADGTVAPRQLAQRIGRLCREPQQGG